MDRVVVFHDDFEMASLRLFENIAYILSGRGLIERRRGEDRWIWTKRVDVFIL